MLETTILTQDLNNEVSYLDYFHAFGYEDKDTIYLRTFNDRDKSKPAQNAEVMLYRFADVLPAFKQRNQQDNGVFYVVNGGGQSQNKVTTVRAHFIDFDDFPFEEQLQRLNGFELEPSIIVKTKKSLHCYWLIDNGNVRLFTQIQQRLNQYFGSDGKIKDLSRVMRLYGFEHRKAAPVMVTLIKFSPELKYTQQQLLDILPELEPAAAAAGDYTGAMQIPSGLETIERDNSHRWLVGWMEKHDIQPHTTITDAANSIVTAVDCPWSREHTEDTGIRQSAVIVKMSGQIGYVCMHSHCADRQWKDYRAFYDADNAAAEEPQTATQPASPATLQESTRKVTESPAGAAESPTAAAGDYLTDFIDKIQGEAYKPYKTGLTFFDDLLGGGLTRQQILLLMAAPAAGKTTLAQQIAESMAANKKPVIYLNLEMSREQMLAKAISSRLARKKDGRVFMNTMQILQGYNWTDEQRTAITAEVDEYRQQIFPYLRYNPDGTSSDLTTIREYLNQIGKQEREKGNEAPAVVLDYLHLVSDSKLETQELLKQTMTVLKDYAVEYNTCAIGITASNRKSNEKGNLTMESGRDSSNLEYGADIVLSLNYYLIDSGKVKPTDNEKIAQLQQEALRQMIIRVLKGRFVTPGKTARVYFSAAYNTFYGESEWMPAGLERIPFEEPKKATPANRI